MSDTRARWHLAVSLAALALVGLSFVDGWITHDRELRGEGYRFVHVVLHAWEAPAFPVLGAGIVLAVAAGTAALVAWRTRSDRAAWASLLAAVVALGAIGASLVPVGQGGRASSVDLSVGPVAIAGTVLAAVMVGAAGVTVRPSRRAMGLLVLLGVLALGAAVGGRWLVLQGRERTVENWSQGSYARPATDGQPEATLVIGDGTFRIGDRWSGTWEGTGLTIVIEADPACPDARGAYHVHDEGASGEDLRFVAIQDPCADGARRAELETGIWLRQP